MTEGKIISTSTASTSYILSRARMANMRIVIEIFDGTGHFGVWQSELLDAKVMFVASSNLFNFSNEEFASRFNFLFQ